MYRYNITSPVFIYLSNALYIDNCYFDIAEDILIGDIVCEDGFVAYNAYFKYNNLPDGRMELMCL